MTNKYCIMPFASIRIEDTADVNGMGIKPCCLYRPDSTTKFSSVDEYLNSQLLKDLQSHLLSKDTLPRECSVCAQAESQNRQSVRQLKQKFFGDQYLEHTNIQEIDLFPSNLCNLKCIMCNPKFSSAVGAEDKAVGFQTTIRNFDITDKVVDAIHQFKDARWITIAGGEFFYHKRAKDILQSIKNSNVERLKIITNGTVVEFPHFDLLSQIPGVTIRFSIDGTHDNYDLIRYPSNWSMMEKNIKIYFQQLPNASFESVMVLQPLNIYSIFSWAEFMNHNKIETHWQLINGDKFTWEILTDSERRAVSDWLYQKTLATDLLPLQKVNLLNYAKNVLPSISHDPVRRTENIHRLIKILNYRKFEKQKIHQVLSFYPDLLEQVIEGLIY